MFLNQDKQFLKKILFSLMACMVIFSNVTFADTGDFYKKYKADFDQVEQYLGKWYINDFAKKYDADTNKFDCGTLSIDCHILSFQYTVGFSVANFSTGLMKVIVKDPDAIVKDKGLNRYKGYLTTLANSLLPMFLVWHMLVMAMRRMGDPDDYHQALNQKLLGVFAGATLLALYNPIFSIILELQNDMLNGIISSAVDPDSLKLMMFLWSPQYSYIIFIFVFFAVLIFGLAVLYRFVALSFMFMVGPLAIATIMNDEFNYFKLWVKYTANNIVTFLMQAIAYTYCMQILTGENSYVKSFPLVTQPIMAVSLVLVASFFALTIPFILGGLGSSSGTGRTIGRVARIMMRR